jgi:FdhE protein
LEWRVNRILCPACFEEDPRRLPSFQNDRHPSVRVEACETCRRYVKSLDLSLDARPIPEVDDLVSIGMDLWAVDQGYTRIEPGLAGL